MTSTATLPSTRLCLAIAVALLPLVSPAFAATSTPSDAETEAGAPAVDTTAEPGTGAIDPRHKEPKTLEAVEVTASPLGGSASDMVQPVEVLAGEKLDAAKAATLGETVGKLPGVQSSNFGAGVGRPIIRGLDGARVAVVAGGIGTQDVSTVSQDHNVTIEPFLADQIEVLKGPATLLYGSGAIGGVVNVVDGRIAEDPLEEPFSGRAEARYDSVNDGYTGMMRIDAQAAGGLVLHADGVYRNQQDYDTPLGTQRNSFIDTKTGAIGASLVRDEGFIGFSASRYEDNYGNPGEPGNAAAGEPSVFLAMRQNRVEAKGGIKQPFGIFSGLRASLAHTNYQHTEFEGAEVGTKFLNDATEGRFELTHQPFGNWTGAIGLQGSDREFEAIGEEAFVPRTRTKAMGLFVTERGKWNRLQLDLGARSDRVESSPVGLQKRSFSPLSLSAGALWRVNDAWRLSLNLDRAERAPAEEELFANGPHAATASFEIGNAALAEEQANQAELGLHYHGDRIDAKISAYQTRFNGFIYLADTGLVEDDLPVRQWSQADARFRGVEGEVTAHLVDNDRGRLDLHVFGDRVRATLDEGGNLPRIVPARFGTDLSWDAGAWRTSLGAVRYARQDDVAVGETPTAGYTLVDAHFAYHWDTDNNLGWEVFLDGNNLTNQEAHVHTSYLKDTVVLPGRGIATGIRVFF
jgi:iron complex outermembrane recepter protein